MELSVFPESFFQGPGKNISKFKEFSRNTEKLCFYGSFPGSWRNISNFQEFSKSTGKLSVFPGVSQGPGRTFQLPRSFPRVQGNYLFFQEFPRVLEEHFKIQGHFKEYMEFICFFRSFPGSSWKKISKFQKLSWNSRSIEHHVKSKHVFT